MNELEDPRREDALLLHGKVDNVTPLLRPVSEAALAALVSRGVLSCGASLSVRCAASAPGESLLGERRPEKALVLGMCVWR